MCISESLCCTPEAGTTVIKYIHMHINTKIKLIINFIFNEVS